MASDQEREGRQPEFQIGKNRGTPRCFVQRVRKLLNLREMIFALVKESERSPSEIGVKIRKRLKTKDYAFARMRLVAKSVQQTEKELLEGLSWRDTRRSQLSPLRNSYNVILQGRKEKNKEILHKIISWVNSRPACLAAASGQRASWRMSWAAADAGMAAAFYCSKINRTGSTTEPEPDILPEESTMNFEGEMT